MADSYFPRQQARALIWMKTFAAALVADGARYMVAPADAAAIDAAVGAADAALAVATDPATRTAVSVRRRKNGSSPPSRSAASFTRSSKSTPA